MYITYFTTVFIRNFNFLMFFSRTRAQIITRNMYVPIVSATANSLLSEITLRVIFYFNALSNIFYALIHPIANIKWQTRAQYTVRT